jgi:hypothetical protein
METDGSDDVLVSDSDGSDEEEPTVTLTGFLEESGVTILGDRQRERERGLDRDKAECTGGKER